MEIGVNGPLLIVGGAEDKDGDLKILKRFVELSGGKKARIGVATAATKKPEEAALVYADIFRELGVESVEPLLLKGRESALSEKSLSTLTNLTGIFFTGGDQLRISSIISGTSFEDLLIKRNQDGLVIGGTSAGASMMSSLMIVGGSNDDTAKKSIVSLSPGLGFIRGVVIDQHFAQRGRVGRLLSVIAQNPATLGIGIDEDTAIEVTAKGVFSVVGSQTVTILDGRNMTEGNASEQTPDEPLSLLNVTLHTLSSGYSYDLNTREPFKEKKTPSKEKSQSKIL
jgi:cyanophycinase